MGLEENYHINMKFLKNTWNYIYNEVEKTDISDYELFITPTGEYNISKNGQAIYPMGVNSALEAQVDAFLKEPPMFFKKPTWNKDNEYIDYYHDKLIKGIEINSSYLKERKNFENYYKNIDKYFPFLLMLGIGAGYHLEKLIKKSKGIKELIIVDESYEMLKISFHLVDWRPIFRYFKRENHNLYFIIDDSYIENVTITLNTIYKDMPYQFFLTPYYTHYKSKFFNDFKELFLENVKLGFTGLGFYDDEIISLTHTIRNLNDKLPVYRYNNKLPKNSTVFLIGSGPSIDKDMEYIKKHKDKVIIISCGSALRILYKNDIVPDFHMEIERPPEMLSIIEEYGSKEYLKKINIIGLNVIYHKVYELFKSARIYFRDNDAGSSIIPEDIPKLNHCNPTIVNGTLSFLSDIGFKNIFMFGTDMGFKDHKNHHSKDSIYYENHILEGIEVNKEKYVGNFDKNKKKFTTTPIFNWCKQRVENCIQDYKLKREKDINYFNCSDGIEIKGTIPFYSKNIQIEKSLNKEEMLKAIDLSFDSDFDHLNKEIKEIYSLEKKELFNNIQRIRDEIKIKEIKNFQELFILISKTFEFINKPNYHRKSYLSRSILKGTMYHFYSSLYTHALATSNKSDGIKYVNESLLKLLEFLDEAETTLKNIELK